MTPAYLHCECPKGYLHVEGHCTITTPLYGRLRQRTWLLRFLGPKVYYLCRDCIIPGDKKYQEHGGGTVE